MSDSNNVLRLPPLSQQVSAGRVPVRDTHCLVHRNCPVCKAEHVSIICYRPDSLPVGQCRICGMIYVTDIPNQANIERFYRDYSHYKGLRSGKPSYLRIKLFDWHNPHLLILKMTGGVKGKNLCEVGCSFGSFLQQAKNNGACVSGVELDENATEYLKHLGIPCVKTVDTKKTFDIVCAFQLIEHLSDPGKFVKEISSVLPENGRFLLALPNGGEAEKVGLAWVGFRVDLEHFNYFSVRSLSILLRQHGLYIEHFWEYNQPGIWRKDQMSAKADGSLKQFWQKPIALLSRLVFRPFYMRGTFVLTVLARKTKK